ncbi:unnamed protein product, partial [Discosporangium mesarthrocarpum]
GHRHVINLVIDNWAQWFVTVPGAINLVQGPANYENLLRMGVPSDQLRLAGHWVPKEMRDNIELDCRSRMVRAKDGRSPRRLLVPVGGAGAQRKFVSGFVAGLKQEIVDGKVRVFLNAGDHTHMHKALKEALEKMGVEYQVLTTFDEMKALADKLVEGQKAAGRERKAPAVEEVLSSEEGVPPVTLLAFDNYFAAVAATDIMLRASDILCCKPSEMAFYPAPKLMIRRVGDHEAHSATRAQELGDGTKEVRTLEEASKYVEMMCSPSDPALFMNMNRCVIANAGAGVYDGCKVAVELAAELAKQA